MEPDIHHIEEVHPSLVEYSYLHKGRQAVVAHVGHTRSIAELVRSMRHMWEVEFVAASGLVEPWRTLDNCSSTWPGSLFDDVPRLEGASGSS